MKNLIAQLTKAQKETFEILVNLGDSKELALKTVQAQEPRTEEELNFYRNAYES